VKAGAALADDGVWHILLKFRAFVLNCRYFFLIDSIAEATVPLRKRLSTG